jgi:preprotein translocase subunit Sec61beta
MADMNMPSGFGGLLRYKEEYDSKLKMSPSMVIVIIILAIIAVLALRFIFPIPVAG